MWRYALKHKNLYHSTGFFMFILIRRLWMIGDGHPHFSLLSYQQARDIVDAPVIIVFAFLKYRLH